MEPSSVRNRPRTSLKGLDNKQGKKGEGGRKQGGEEGREGTRRDGPYSVYMNSSRGSSLRTFKNMFPSFPPPPSLTYVLSAKCSLFLFVPYRTVPYRAETLSLVPLLCRLSDQTTNWLASLGQSRTWYTTELSSLLCARWSSSRLASGQARLDVIFVISVYIYVCIDGFSDECTTVQYNRSFYFTFGAPWCLSTYYVRTRELTIITYPALCFVRCVLRGRIA